MSPPLLFMSAAFFSWFSDPCAPWWWWWGGWQDADGDGIYACEDCNDEDASVGPGVPEVPDNGVDEDCDDVDASLETSLLINEVHYDPSNADLDGDGNQDGDANGDGTRSASADEFVEFVNVGTSALDLSGVTLWDDENLNDVDSDTYGVPNHLVPDDTIIEPGSAFVVFGGGTLAGSFGTATVQTSTSGNLNLNNAGDILYVQDAGGTTRLTFDIEPLSNNPNESYTRSPDIAGDFEQHDDHTDRLFSPGTRVDGTEFFAPVEGTGSYTFVPDPERPMNVYYHVPDGCTKWSPIVMVFHGNGREAAPYRDAWIDAADEHEFVIVATGTRPSSCSARPYGATMQVAWGAASTSATRPGSRPRATRRSSTT